MTLSRDMMETKPLVVSPNTPVRSLAEQLLSRRLDGACVVEDEKLLGVVTAMDLVFREQPVHLPSFISFMDFMIPLDRPGRLNDEFKKLTGHKVGEIMTKDPITVTLDSPLAESAKLMVSKHLTMLPVLDKEGALAGVITKVALLRRAFDLDASSDSE